MKSKSLKKWQILNTMIMTLALLLCVNWANALDVTPADPDLTFNWEAGDADLSNYAGFKIYWSDTINGTYTPILDVNSQPIVIPYDANDPNQPACTQADPCFADQEFIVSGTPGSRFVKFFKMTAVSTDNQESSFSEAAVDENGSAEVWFVNPIGRPFGVRVGITRQ